MLVKKGRASSTELLPRTAFAKVDVTVVYAHATGLSSNPRSLRPGFSVRFPNACFGACRLVSDIGQHDFTGCDLRHGCCLFALSCLVLLISKIVIFLESQCAANTVRAGKQGRGNYVAYPCPARIAHMHCNCTATVGHGSMNERGTCDGNMHTG
jgi:hypothetical protein